MEILTAQVLIPLLGIILVAVIKPVINKISQRFDIEIEDKTINSAVLYVEEYARNQLNKYGQKIPSSEKLDMAMQFVIDAIPAASKEAYQDRLRSKIEAKVNELLHQNDLAPAAQ